MQRVPGLVARQRFACKPREGTGPEEGALMRSPAERRRGSGAIRRLAQVMGRRPEVGSGPEVGMDGAE